MTSLLEFYQNEDMRNNVREYLVQSLKEQVVELAFEEKSVAGAVLAKNSIDKAFENMDILFSPKSQEKEITNEAR